MSADVALGSEVVDELKRSLASSWLVAAGLLVAVVAVSDARRGTWPLNIDEAAYLSHARSLADPLRHGDLHLMAHRFLHDQGGVAPLAPLFVAPLIAAGANPVVAAYAVLGLLAAVLLWSTGRVADRLVQGSGPTVATVLVATAAVVMYAGDFVFALPTAAMFALATWCLVESDSLTSIPWSLATGAAAGAAVLARTVSLALAPAFFLAVLAAIWPRFREQPRRVLTGLLLATAAAAVIFVPWYLDNAHDVYNYLTGFGYGTQSATYSGNLKPSGIDFYLHRPRQLLGNFGLAAALALALGIAFGRRRHTTPVERQLVVLLAVWLAAGLVTLGSSTNSGSGFTLPLLPAVVLLLVAAAGKLGRAPRLLPAVPVVLAAVVVVCLRSPVPARPGHGLDGFATAVGLQSSLSQYFQVAGFADGHPGRWKNVNLEVLQAAAGHPVVLSGQHPLLNTNSLGFLAEETGRPAHVTVIATTPPARGELYVEVPRPVFPPAAAPAVLVAAERVCRPKTTFGSVAVALC